MTGTGLHVCAVCGSFSCVFHISSALPWSAVTIRVPPASRTALTMRLRQRSMVSTACHCRVEVSRVADHVGIREVADDDVVLAGLRRR